MLRAAVILLLIAGFGHPALAETRAAPAGQPICVSQEALARFLVAGLSGQTSPVPGCKQLPRASRVVVVQEFPSETDFGNILRVRALLDGRTMTGYTLSIGLQQ